MKGVRLIGAALLVVSTPVLAQGEDWDENAWRTPDLLVTVTRLTDDQVSVAVASAFEIPTRELIVTLRHDGLAPETLVNEQRLQSVADDAYDRRLPFTWSRWIFVQVHRESHLTPIGGTIDPVTGTTTSIAMPVPGMSIEAQWDGGSRFSFRAIQYECRSRNPVRRTERSVAKSFQCNIESVKNRTAGLVPGT